MIRDQALAWFFDGADGDLGLRGMSLEPTTRSEGDAPEGPTQRQIDSATRSGSPHLMSDNLSKNGERIVGVPACDLASLRDASRSVGRRPLQQ